MKKSLKKTKEIKMMKGLIRTCLLILLTCSTACSQSFDQQHSTWNKFLSENVKHTDKPISTSLVNYSSNTLLDSYISQLESLNNGQFDKFSESEKLAFLINAYNAFTIELIQKNTDKLGSPKSIKNITTDSPWKIKFINILGETYSLDQIEHEMIRAQFEEPRIHFALVCAAISCPKLQDFAFTADKLEQQLEQSKKEFLKNRSKNYYKSKTLYISKVFEWFKDDFVKNGQTIKGYVGKDIASSGEVYQELLSDETKIEYLDYDWTLNNSN